MIPSPLQLGLAGALLLCAPLPAQVGRESLVLDGADTTLRFGETVAMDGEWMVAAAVNKSTPIVNAGAVYVFRRSTGRLEYRLQLPTPDSDDSFGSSVALAGDRLLVGARTDDSSGTSAGAIRVFDVSTGSLLDTWVLSQPESFHFFGHALATHGGTALVGAPSERPVEASGAEPTSSISIRRTAGTPRPFCAPEPPVLAETTPRIRDARVLRVMAPCCTPTARPVPQPTT